MITAQSMYIIGKGSCSRMSRANSIGVVKSSSGGYNFCSDNLFQLVGMKGDIILKVIGKAHLCKGGTDKFSAMRFLHAQCHNGPGNCIGFGELCIGLASVPSCCFKKKMVTHKVYWQKSFCKSLWTR